MNKQFLLFIALIVNTLLIAQPNWKDKIKWSFSVEKIDDNHAWIIGKAKLTEGWHIFSVNHDPAKADFTGSPTEFMFSKSSDFKLVGKLQDGAKAHKVIDDLGEQLFFEKNASFKQQIEVLTDKPFKVTVDYSFQICDANGCVFPPAQREVLDLSGFKPAETASAEPIESTTQPTTETPKQPKEDRLEPNKDIPTTEKPKSSNWLVFALGFLAGLVALVTPCMFPMIPMTVTFFTRQSKTRREGIFKAMVYGLSIIFIYVTFGVSFTAIAGPFGLNNLASNMWMNLVFFGIFVLFAFSFLGAFEIQLPSAFVNKMDRQADRGGLIGIFFMAFTLGLVSFSCTGPIIGSLLVEAATSGSYFTPAIGMTGFSLALAIPFTLFAIFPSWLNSLPQSGGWLNSVKVVLGLLELALALKFLSSVDLAYHWNILSREWFVGIWFVLFLIMGLYLLGKIQFAHDSPVERLSVPRFMFSLAALVFSVYLFTGMFGAPLHLIEGIAPPRTHSEDNFRYVNGGLETGIVEDTITERFKEHMHPVGDGSILVFHDLNIATDYAKARNLPILLDFTGYTCQNCRKTESYVWPNDEIRPILQKKVVIASLYCDDKTPLPESEVRYSEVAQGWLRRVGDKWGELQAKKYKTFQQPLYVLIDHEWNDLTDPIGYTPDVKKYKAFLDKGINKFNKIKK